MKTKKIKQKCTFKKKNNERMLVKIGLVVVGVYLRPVSGCINAGCVAVVAVLGCGFGLLTFVLLLANSKRIVCGISGSNRTPCCNIWCVIFGFLFDSLTTKFYLFIQI